MSTISDWPCCCVLTNRAENGVPWIDRIPVFPVWTRPRDVFIFQNCSVIIITPSRWAARGGFAGGQWNYRALQEEEEEEIEEKSVPSKKKKKKGASNIIYRFNILLFFNGEFSASAHFSSSQWNVTPGQICKRLRTLQCVWFYIGRFIFYGPTTK